jgi:chromosome segregation ATPase
MTDAGNLAKGLRQRLSGTTEERLGRALSDLLENPLLTGAIGRAFDAREKATQAQEVALGALNIPSAADIERLTRRLRSVSHRLEGIEDGVHRLDQALAPTREDGSEIDQRLSAIERQLGTLTERLSPAPSTAAKPAGSKATKPARRTAAKSAGRTAAKSAGRTAAAKSAGRAAAKSAGRTVAAKPAGGGKAKQGSGGKAKPASPPAGERED